MHNRRNQVASKPRPPRPIVGRNAPMPQPPDAVTIPPPRAARVKPPDLPLPMAPPPPGPAAPALFALPERGGPEPARPPARPKRRKGQSRRRKPGGKVRTVKPAQPRPGPAPAASDTAPALPLPAHAEPLVLSAPAPRGAPGRALAVIQNPGLLGAIGAWLSQRARGLWHQLGTAPHHRDRAEIRRLRAENSRLRAQLEAFAALQAGAAFVPPDRARSPLS